jgi:type IV secretory pathway TraG/TraD family ATPase VirD4
MQFLFELFGLHAALPGVILAYITLNTNSKLLKKSILLEDEQETTFLNLFWRFSLLSFVAIMAGAFSAIFTKPILGTNGALYGGALVFLGAYLLYLLYSQPKKPKAEPTKKIDLKDYSFYWHTHQGDLVCDNAFRGVFISGGAGAGKTASITTQIIYRAADLKFTGIVYDYKSPDITPIVSSRYGKERNGIKLYNVDFNDLSRCHRINPIAPQIINSAADARDAAITLLSNIDYKSYVQRNYWIQASESLLTGFILLFRNRYPEFCTLPHIISLIQLYDPKTAINLLKEDSEASLAAASIVSSTTDGLEKQLGGIYSNLQNFLSPLANKETFWVLSRNEVPFDLNSPESPGLLCVGVGFKKVYTPLASLVITSRLRRMNQPGRLPSMVLLEEAPTIFIPNLQDYPATGRSNKLMTVYLAQDMAQMVKDLGEPETKALLSNLGTQFFGRATDPKTAKHVSEIFGKKDVIYTTYSQSRTKKNILDYSDTSGTSQTVQQRDIIEPSEVTKFQTGEFAGIISEGNMNHFRLLFKAPEQKKVEIKQRQITNQDIQNNFLSIQKQVKSIIPTTVQRERPETYNESSHNNNEENTNSTNWEDFG